MKEFNWTFAVLCLCSFLSKLVVGNDFKGFDDNILFSLNFPGDKLVSKMLLITYLLTIQ